MMPADNMTSLVQRIARQALVTFKNVPHVGEASKTFSAENLLALKSLMTEVRAADLKLIPRKVDSSSPFPSYPYAAPVTYMHICETDQFSMGVFHLRSGASIPLHDHPGMHGLLKVMYGKVRITCFDKLDASQAGAASQKGGLRRAALRSSGEYTEDSAPCLLTPNRDNIHQIDAVDGPTAFLDILAPPYEPDEGRDCHYYKVTPAEVNENQGKAPQESPGQSKEVWLTEISQPAEFWCGSEPYPGPNVSL